PVPSDLTPLPPADTWVNVRSLGARGDGSTDDTAAFRKAIAGHSAVYVPSGNYIITGTLSLRPDTALIGLHPLATQLILPDRTPAFQGPGAPVPLLETPHGGRNIVIGIGLYTNGINPRAVAAKWMAGPASLMNDVRFLGGHGTTRPDGSRDNPYNNTHTADPDLNRRWDSQYPSLWVTNGGGGTFFDIWTPSTFAQSGMTISDTATPGRVYQMSSEHHVRYEVQLHNAANWELYALQTEEERGEGPFALPLEISGSRDITVANMHIYRVISSYQPFPYAIAVSDSKNIRFRNIHCYSNSKVSFDASVYDATRGLPLRQREFASLTLTGDAPPPTRPAAAGPKVEKLASGFFNISGGAAAPNGDYYFVDAHWQRVYRWNAAARQLSVVSDFPLEPVNLAFDKAGHLLIVSYAGNGTVYTIQEKQVRFLEAVPAAPRPGLTAILPTGDWRVQSAPSPFHYLSPDGATFIPAGRDFTTGAMSWGVKSAALLRSFGLAPAQPGKPFYISSEAEAVTWKAAVTPEGNLANLQPFVYQGGECAIAGPAGNVYLAAGQVYVYSPEGRLLRTIEVPERPTHLAFGGKDARTLFIAARTSLYALPLPAR
ncbi:MAG: SMP-30/gluconolactonase/LRE family protein, partial [Acidobacteriota bacterium]|nr:SMP-30/gluconolactonase/LRE family protein [Acidobacteriota bacterium]